jgi:DNA-directed RNA polymerase subunit RPC12/RpoP
MDNEIPKVEGSIHISHSVDCPHCNERMYDDLDREWWNKNITDQLPDDECYMDQYDIKCKECGKEFIIDGFTY